MHQESHKYESGIVRMIAEATDHDTAMKIVDAFCGMRIAIPFKAREGHQLPAVVGVEATEKLIERFGSGTRIEIPIERLNVIRWLKKKGMSQERIAHRLRISRRAVQYYQHGNFPKWPGPAGDDESGPPDGAANTPATDTVSVAENTPPRATGEARK